MKKTNYHMHTERCHHAYGSEESFIKKCIKEGFEEVGFSDHCCWKYNSRYVSRIRMTVKDFDDYKKTILSLKEKYKNKINILLGMEAEYFEDYMDWMLDFCIEQDIDYLILGNHFWKSDEHGVYYGYCDEKYLPDYFEACIKALKTGMYAYFAHPELPFRNPDLEWNDYIEEKYTEICKLCKELDIPLEFNCLGYQANVREGFEMYPNQNFWRIASKFQNKAIIGMDAHQVHDLDSKWYERALDYLSDYDVEIVDSIQKIDYKKIKKSR